MKVPDWAYLGTRPGAWEIESGDLALYFARKPTPKMVENAKRTTS